MLHYQRARDDGLLVIFTFISLEQHQGHMGNLRTCYNGNSLSIRAQINKNSSSLARSQLKVYGLGKTALIELAIYKYPPLNYRCCAALVQDERF